MALRILSFSPNLRSSGAYLSLHIRFTRSTHPLYGSLGECTLHFLRMHEFAAQFPLLLQSRGKPKK